MRFTQKDPDTGYLNHNLLLPRRYVNEHAIRTALTFQMDTEEDVIDDVTGERVGRRKRVLELWDCTRHHLVVPREFINPQDIHKFRFPIVDERPTNFERVHIGHAIEFREGQELAFQAMLRNHSGTLNLACGKGKTVMALRFAAELGVPTLIVVNTTALMEQWRDNIESLLHVESIGTIQGQVSDWRNHAIVLATIHTLSARAEYHTPEFRNRFGLAIYDEGHHMSAPVFCLGADVCAGRRLSLTATPDRTDGLEAIYQYHLGRVIYSDLEQELEPRTVFHRLKWRIPQQDYHLTLDRAGEPNVGKRRAYIGQVRWRNQLALDLIDQDLAEGRQILVLSHSVPHLETLHGMARHLRQRGLIIGDTDQTERMPELRDKNPIFATFHLAREGLDKPELDTLYVLTPFSNKNDLQQAWGRTLRVFDGKREPLVRVFEDEDISANAKACRAMRKIIRAMGWESERVLTEER